MTRKRDEFLELIMRGRRTIVESRRILLSSSQLMSERQRLRYLTKTLFHDIATLTREFVEQVDRQKLAPPEESQSSHRP